VDLKALNPRVIEQFRTGGAIEGMRRERLILLTTVGRRTGRRHTAPMMFHAEGDRLLVMASNNGATAHPDWYLNLVESPAVTVEVGDEWFEAVAKPLAGEERARTWARIKELYPFFAEHEQRAGREIPVVALSRKSKADA
jgi:deazaflavin-dependent oxidoreductase (nitroreductase family)